MSNVPLPTLDTLSRQIKAAVTNLSSAEGKVKSCQIVVGKLLCLAQEIYMKDGGFPNGFGKFHLHTINDLTFQQWAVSETGRSWKSCCTLIGFGRHSETYNLARQAIIESSKKRGIAGSIARVKEAVGIPSVPLPAIIKTMTGRNKYSGRIPEDMAKRYRVDNAVAVLDALADDEYAEVMTRQKRVKDA